MANKIGLILSLFTFVQALIFSGDIIGYQLIISEVLTQTVYLNQLIAQQGGIDDEVYTFVEEKLGGTIECLSNCSPDVGDSLEYVVSKPYYPFFPMVWGNEMAHIAIKRSVLIGYTL